jgi:hypothetical protein
MSFEIITFLGDEVQKSALQLTVGWIGNALALFFFFSPAVKIFALWKEKISHTEFSYFSLIANIMNCLLWFVYGFRRDTLEIWVCNMVGGLTNLIYLIIFWFYFSNKNLVKFSFFFTATLGVLFAIFAVFYWAFDSYEVAGKTAMVFNIIMYAAPGQKLVLCYINQNRSKCIKLKNMSFYLSKVRSLDYYVPYAGSFILF